MEKLKLNLTCSYCKKIFKNPVELPCEDLICKEHLNDKEVIRQNKIKCHECKQEYEVNGNEFNLNKSIQKQIDKKLFLNEEELTLKQKIEESIKLFYTTHEELLSSKTKFDLDCHNHFQEIRFQLDIHREKLKEKIDDIYMEMVEHTKEFETLSLKSFNDASKTILESFEIRSIDEALNTIEEHFRDSNILIKKIQEINLKHEKALEVIKSTLIDISEIKEDLKASNKFIPNSFFDKSSFGKLNLKHFQNDTFGSQILTRNQRLELTELCEFNLEDKFELLYRASEHGFGSNYFHSKCDGHAKTLTIFKANGYIFGGFTEATWDGVSGDKSDPNAFLFSLTNKENKPCKMNIDPNQHQKAIYCKSGYGPTFYGGIIIYSNANTGCSNLGSSYKHPQYAYGSNEAKSFLAGSEDFQVSEIEVYQK